MRFMSKIFYQFYIERDEKLEKLKDDFDKFNDKFLEYSRLYHIMKGRIKAQQDSYKRQKHKIK